MTGFKKRQGHANRAKGAMAEDQVAEAYRRNGFEIVERRFRVREGEIDLIARHAGKIYFVEVKSSATHEQAVDMITSCQRRRIRQAALRYLAKTAKTVDVDCRFDAALVDASGRLKVIPDALHFH